MNQFSDFLYKLGGLHDARLVALNWDPDLQAIEFVVDDLYANFAGLPEYPGRQKAVIRLEEVARIEVEIDTSKELRFFEFLPVNGRENEVLMSFSPGGHVRLRYTSATYPVSLI